MPENKELEERKQKFLDGYKTLREETQIDIFFVPQCTCKAKNYDSNCPLASERDFIYE
jgi:hypothetical protein